MGGAQGARRGAVRGVVVPRRPPGAGPRGQGLPRQAPARRCRSTPRTAARSPSVSTGWGSSASSPSPDWRRPTTTRWSSRRCACTRPAGPDRRGRSRPRRLRWPRARAAPDERPPRGSPRRARRRAARRRSRRRGDPARAGAAPAVPPSAPRPGSGWTSDGRTVVPGLWDAHTHLTQWAMVRQRLDVSAATSAAHAAALVRDRLDLAAPPPDGQPLVGYGFRWATWPDDPTAAVLDAVAGEVPGGAALRGPAQRVGVRRRACASSASRTTRPGCSARRSGCRPARASSPWTTPWPTRSWSTRRAPPPARRGRWSTTRWRTTSPRGAGASRAAGTDCACARRCGSSTWAPCSTPGCGTATRSPSATGPTSSRRGR